MEMERKKKRNRKEERIKTKGEAESIICLTYKKCRKMWVEKFGVPTTHHTLSVSAFIAD